MISSVSNVSFKSNQDLINSPGQFAAPAVKAESMPDEFVSKKKSKAPLALGTALVVALATFAGLGYAVKSGKLAKVEGAEKFMDKVKNFGFSIGEKAEQCWNKITGLFSKKAEKTAEAATTAENAAKA